MRPDPPPIVPDLRAVTDVTLRGYPLERRGKVRDIFSLGDDLLIVATDRISAFDVVLPTPIPGKGLILTQISEFWFDALAGIVADHRTDRTFDKLDLDKGERTALRGRSSIVRRAQRIDVECVVRRHLAGTGWREYAASGTLAGERLPPGLGRGERLDHPRFTPATKNDRGHDENISRADLAQGVGEDMAGRLEDISLRLFAAGSELAARAGFIIADTKFEFGLIDGTLALIDEVFTPDSSRYWDAGSWRPGNEPVGFDKQPVRDWLDASGWDKLPPGPALPPEIVGSTIDRYQQVHDRLAAVGTAFTEQEPAWRR